MRLYLNRGKNILCIVIVLSLCMSMDSLTGPSYIYAEIKPISINKKGEILCKTRFLKNETGGHYDIKTEYGFCMLSKDTIIEFKTKIIDPSDPDLFDYYEERKLWDSIFKSETSQQQLNEINKVILKNKHRFLSKNIDSFKVNKILSISDFEETRNISLKNNQQIGLYGASNIEYYDDKKVHLLYDFGNILIFNNCNNLYDDEFEIEAEVGADFDYYNSANIWVSDSGKHISLGFEISKVTGVLIIK
ncbi:hypothetical protein [Flavivirga algicola]|uniref:Uncharacterized protein n=1 Tax=Flavivirga algicola TaxID=2729136 RepID=A0ABX1S2H1_9FLAO|nr:hypothetical protein [Flavivirga algicola]NMH89586.1 hypothetical protein [Flavivirga algicola]